MQTQHSKSHRMCLSKSMTVASQFHRNSLTPCILILYTLCLKSVVPVHLARSDREAYTDLFNYFYIICFIHYTVEFTVGKHSSRAYFSFLCPSTLAELLPFLPLFSEP